MSAAAVLWVCDDCRDAAEGTAEGWPTVPDPVPWSLIPWGDVYVPGLPWSEHSCGRATGLDGSECDCETTTYSTTPCDACGSTLAGSRHAYTLTDERP